MAIKDAADLTQFLMRQLQEFLEQTELVHELEGRGMNGVATEVAMEIGVFLQHHDFHSGAREQERGHHSGGAAANDNAPRAARRRHTSDVRREKADLKLAESPLAPLSGNERRRAHPRPETSGVL